MADNNKITPQNEDYSRWYLDVIREAELAEDSPVRGSMVIRPYGYALWEAIQSGLDRRFKATGHVNAYFPLFIPKSFLQKETEHIEGFSPELAVVTIGGGNTLEEPLVVRPTSETIIGHHYAKWIQSYRDLPLLINQWANVVRWEMRTRPFLRTMEFLWQEGHTAHATEKEAREETLRMLDVYVDFAENDAAIPVIKGVKSDREKFAGAVDSYTIEGMMGNGWALQMGTSHYLGTKFAQAFNVSFLDQNNVTQLCHTTSWGISTRMVGAVIMAHGDDRGLRLPPALAPIQVVIVPIWRKEAERGPVLEIADHVHASLRDEGMRVKVDRRDDQTPGFKFNDWEMRGVPIRIEIGPKDVQQQSAVLARRDRPGKEGKNFGVPLAGVAQETRTLLHSIQENLRHQALQKRTDNTHRVTSYTAFQDVLREQGGFLHVHWAGTTQDEERIQKETKATLRCLPMENAKEEGQCVLTGKRTNQTAIFARAY
ncbi:MAG: proline--tRNA ligase [Nitrospiraceae bacterium]|nr:proline--tRNA ligase [Nitrospiraceae bacterium]